MVDKTHKQEKRAEYARTYRENNREKINGYGRKYRETKKKNQPIADEATRKLWAEQEVASLADWEARFGKGK